MPEMLLIFAVILLLFGAKKLPEFARGMGKSMGEFKKAREDFERELTTAEVESRRKDDVRKKDEPVVKEAAGKEPMDS
jgi:sec-independent protein translocase protein TatA